MFSLEGLIAEETGGTDEFSVDESAQHKIFEAGGGHRFNRGGAMFVRRFAEGLRMLMERLQSELPEYGGVFSAEDTNHLRLVYKHDLMFRQRWWRSIGRSLNSNSGLNHFRKPCISWPNGAGEKVWHRFDR